MNGKNRTKLAFAALIAAGTLAPAAVAQPAGPSAAPTTSAAPSLSGVPEPPAAGSGSSVVDGSPPGVVNVARQPGTPVPLTPPGAWRSRDSVVMDPSRAAQRDAARMTEWRSRYAGAQKKLVEGQFAEAADEFYALAASAPGTNEYDHALEQWSICGTLARRGLMLVPRRDFQETDLHQRMVGQRTTGEIISLYSTGIFYGLGTGVWTSILAEPDSVAGYVMPALMFGAATAGAVALADSAGPFRYGVPQSIATGVQLGFQEGLYLTLWNQAKSHHRDQWGAKTVASLMWMSATAGGVVGGLAANALGATPGRASYVGSLGMWSAGVGALASAALTDSSHFRDDNAMLVGAIGLNAGIAAALATAGAVSPSLARVRWFDLGGLCGAIVGGGIYVSAADHIDDRPLYGWLAGGIAAGLGIAWAATSGMAPDRPEPNERAAPASTVASWNFGLVPVTNGMGVGVQGTLL